MAARDGAAAAPIIAVSMEARRNSGGDVIECNVGNLLAEAAAERASRPSVRSLGDFSRDAATPVDAGLGSSAAACSLGFVSGIDGSISALGSALMTKLKFLGMETHLWFLSNVFLYR